VPQSLYSPSWYRVANLKPRLRAHAELHRQRFRGDIWYLLQDHQSGQYHRLSPAAHLVVCMMDGRRSVQDIWTRVGEKLGEEQPTQDEIVRLMAQLHSADLIAGEVPPNMEELSERSDRHVRRGLLMRIRNPMALRFPLFDPDRFLAVTLPLVRPLFSIPGFLAWLALVATGAVTAAMNAGALANNLQDQALTSQNVALLLLTYPLVKALHELGHAYASKVWDGEVHEIGVMFLIFVPVPYVDASASAAFRSKWRRALVGGAGIMVETALAAAAMLVWISAEPGLVRAFAFNVMLIGGVSTLLFNGNPLLRFDGYYVLADVIEIPNLGTRANKYLMYLIQRYAFAMDDTQSPVTARGEAPWFVFYALAALAYRLWIMLTIALFVAGKMFFVGIALAIVSLAGTVIWPIVKAIHFIAESPQLQRRRRRAILVTSTVAAAIAALVLAVPLPYATMAQGVVWVGDQSTVRAMADEFVTEVAVGNGLRVEPGATLVKGEDPILVAGVAVLEKQLEELQVRLDAATPRDAGAANMLREQIKHTEGQLALSRRHLADLDVPAPKGGEFLVMSEGDLPGRFVRKGEVIGYVVGDDDPIVCVVVAQTDVDPVRRSTVRIDVRLADHIEQALPASVLREVPAALAEIPHLALSTTGGGPVVLDPSKTDHPQPLETLFHFDLRVAGLVDRSRLGGRAYVRFEHAPEPIAFRLVRAARQLFLRQFGV
jgi:putative peptide zinc metalloprotease protein